MHKAVLFLITFLLGSLCNGQVTLHFLDHKIMRENRVSKVIQVNRTDTTIKPCYAIYNERGQVIVSNKINYEYHSDSEAYEIVEEIIYRYYDEDGKLISQINYVPTSEDPIKNVFLHSRDTSSGITTHLGFSSFGEGEGRIDLSTEPVDTSSIRQDTIWVTKRHAKVPYYQWGKKTYYEEIKFGHNGRIERAERIELAFKPGIYEHIVKTSYHYDKNGTLFSKTENRFDEKGKHYETDEFYYSENGLLKRALLNDQRNQTVREFEFSYEYRK